MEESTAAGAWGYHHWQNGKKDQNRRRVADLPQHCRQRDDHPVFLFTNCWRCIPQPAISMVVFWWKIPPVRGFSLR